MADKNRPTPAEDPSFETDTVEANRAVENGQGLGAKEIAAQRDAGDPRQAVENEDLDQERVDDTRSDATP